MAPPPSTAVAAAGAVGSTMPDWTMDTLYSAALMQLLPSPSAFHKICGVSTFILYLFVFRSFLQQNLQGQPAE
jgi:alpha-N-acetylglucosamine transferase